MQSFHAVDRHFVFAQVVVHATLVAVDHFSLGLGEERLLPQLVQFLQDTLDTEPHNLVIPQHRSRDRLLEQTVSTRSQVTVGATGTTREHWTVANFVTICYVGGKQLHAKIPCTECQ
ncbi:hypothetical protein D3C73_1222430 [compost metagenome]